MIENQVSSEISNPKKPKRYMKLFPIASIVTTILVIAGLVIFIAIETSKLSKIIIKEEKKCNLAHEDYGNIITSSFLGRYEKFAIAADNKDCSTVGRKIFEKNGSAVDVAIAASLCNSIMNAQSMGIGGGHFMNIFIKEKNMSYIIDAREKAPLNAYKEMFVNRPEKSTTGGLASAIPGEIKGYWEAYKIGGRLPWKDLFQPAIDLCQNGFRISNALSKGLKLKESLIKQNSALANIFVNPRTNSVYKENDTIKMENLGKTLTYISESGPDIFYNGILTGLMVAEINENGGNVTIEDFQKYEARVHKNRFAVRLDDNHRIYVPPPPSSGILVPYIMKIMRGFELADENSMSNETRSLFYHRLTETLKHAYAKRSFLGDETFLSISQLLDDLRDDSYIESVRNKIKDDRTFPSSYYGPAGVKEDAGTAHISVLAPNGDAVGITSTINNYLGAKYAGKYTGIIYNDCMDDFSTPGLSNSFGFVPTEANYIMPGKRALSSMTPIIIVDNNNNVKLVLGASGGSKIISAVSQIAIKSLWMKSDIKTAIDSRRIHHQLLPENLEIEVEFPENIEDLLKDKGHKTKCFNFGGSTVQGVQVVDKSIYAYSDPRKGGQPDGV